jgi:hypothetical protein
MRNILLAFLIVLGLTSAANAQVVILNGHLNRPYYQPYRYHSSFNYESYYHNNLPAYGPNGFIVYPPNSYINPYPYYSRSYYYPYISVPYQQLYQVPGFYYP